MKENPKRKKRTLNNAALISQIPNLFTTGNILSGFFSILFCFEGKPMSAAWLIIAGAFFDFLDGRIARFTKTSSEMGIQLDSLADFLTFGVAPAVFLYTIGIFNFMSWKIVVPVAFMVAAAFRLARFNVTAELTKKADFIGLPSPAAALTIISYYMFFDYIEISKFMEQFYIPLVILVSWLMVSNVRFFSKIKLRKKYRLLQAVFFMIILLLIIFRTQLFFFPILIFYILSCFLREVYLLVSHADSLNKHSKEMDDCLEIDQFDDDDEHNE